MNCFKHLCAKLFLCLVFIGGFGFVLNINAAELDTTGTAEEAATVATPTPEVAAAMEAMAVDTQTALAAAEATMAAMRATAASEATTAADVQPAVVPEATLTQAQAMQENALLVAFAEARAQDVDRLSRIIQTEAGGTFEDKVCVGLTVLHRVDSPKFPNTVEENINAPSQYARPARGEVLPINLLAAEYAMALWENGTSYAILPNQFLYFVGDGKKNKFHDYHGHYHTLPVINPDLITTPYTEDPNGVLLSLRLFFNDFFSNVKFFHVFA